MVRASLLAALWLTAAAAQAQVYKCIDAAGKTTYAQSPCPANSRSGAIARTVPDAPPPAPAAPAGAAPNGKAAKAAGPKTAADLEQEFRKRRREREESQKKDAEKAADARLREDNCRNARQQLVNLESGAPQVRMDEKGGRNYLDPGQIEREKAFAQKAVEQWCK